MNKFDFSTKNLLDLDQTNAKTIFQGITYPWEALPKIKDYILELAKTLPEDFERISEFVWVGKGTTIERTATIKGPAIIGYNCEIRQCAFIRENVIIGNDVVVGNSTEIKNSIIFNKVQIPHFNYAGDSILGYKAHLGAGVILSNVKADKGIVNVRDVDGSKISTGLKKFGAIVGDNVEVGCNSVLNPGTVAGRQSNIYPLTSARGTIPSESILKNDNSIVLKK